ncbi:MAG: Holliday junction branch migration protein RuvA [Duncaniella sp.]|nr:Holliday junction branch migration protein RuvA [Duncaniella sp.]MDE6582365.1 Holliday junction branch migration protein RuvA [Duncaniella sp.]
MLEYISGTQHELTPTTVVIETSGVGYLLNISLTTFAALEKNQEGAPVKLLVQEIIREDAWTLYGFATSEERELFRLLNGVSGVGAATARMILSSMQPAEVEQTIVNGDHSRLKNVKGIGLKTAQRIIVDLKDKIKPSDPTLLLQPDLPNSSAALEEALAALVMLGFPRPQAAKALRKIFDADPSVTVEAAIKKAFTMM